MRARQLLQRFDGHAVQSPTVPLDFPVEALCEPHKQHLLLVLFLILAPAALGGPGADPLGGLEDVELVSRPEVPDPSCS